MQTSIAKQPDAPAISWAQGARSLLLARLRHRLLLASAGIAVTGAGLGLGWDWLSAVGVAPLIVAAAPCLVMCAMGACVMCRSNQGRTAQGAAPTDATPPASEG